jgi:hypothetical protein
VKEIYVYALFIYIHIHIYNIFIDTSEFRTSFGNFRFVNISYFFSEIKITGLCEYINLYQYMYKCLFMYINICIHIIISFKGQCLIYDIKCSYLYLHIYIIIDICIYMTYIYIYKGNLINTLRMAHDYISTVSKYTFLNIYIHIYKDINIYIYIYGYIFGQY